MATWTEKRNKRKSGTEAQFTNVGHSVGAYAPNTVFLDEVPLLGSITVTQGATTFQLVNGEPTSADQVWVHLDGDLAGAAEFHSSVSGTVTFTYKGTGSSLFAHHINALQTEKVDRDGSIPFTGNVTFNGSVGIGAGATSYPLYIRVAADKNLAVRVEAGEVAIATYTNDGAAATSLRFDTGAVRFGGSATVEITSTLSVVGAATFSSTGRFASNLYAGAALRVEGAIAPGAGAGLELQYTAASYQGEVFTYNRDTNVFQALRLRGLNIMLNPGGEGNVLIGGSTDAGYKLDVQGTLRVTGAAAFNSGVLVQGATQGAALIDSYHQSNTVGSGGLVRLQANDSLGNRTTFAQIASYLVDGTNTGEDADLVFSTIRNGSLTEALRLGSTGDVTLNGGVKLPSAAGTIFSNTADAADSGRVVIGGGGGEGWTRGSYAVFSGNEDGNAGTMYLVAGASNVIAFHSSSGSEVARFAGQNFGFGTADVEAWHTSFGVIEFPNSSVMFGKGTYNHAILNSNAYYDSAGWKYKSTQAAASVFLSDGSIILRVAPSNTVDTAITWTDVAWVDTAAINVRSGLALKLNNAANSNTVTLAAWTPAAGDAGLQITTPAAANALKITHGGNVLINTSTDGGYKFDLNGTARLSGTVSHQGFSAPTISNPHRRLHDNWKEYTRESQVANLSTTDVSLFGGEILFNYAMHAVFFIYTTVGDTATFVIMGGKDNGVTYKYSHHGAANCSITESSEGVFAISGLGDGRTYTITFNTGTATATIKADAATSGTTYIGMTLLGF